MKWLKWIIDKIKSEIAYRKRIKELKKNRETILKLLFFK